MRARSARAAPARAPATSRGWPVRVAAPSTPSGFAAAWPFTASPRRRAYCRVRSAMSQEPARRAPRAVPLCGAVLLLLTSPATRAAPRPVSGHVPEVVQRRQAALVGRLPPTRHLDVAIGLPLRDRAG